MKNKRRKRFFLGAIIVLGLFIIVGISLFVLERALHARTFRLDKMEPTLRSGLESQQVLLEGNSIDIVYKDISNPNVKKPKPVLLYFAGNAGRQNHILEYLQERISFLAMAYPGYHRSTGKLSVENALASVSSLYPVLFDIFGDNIDLHVLGHSLGSQTALYFVSEHAERGKIKSLSIVGGFYSVEDECRKSMGALQFICFVAKKSFSAAEYVEAAAGIQLYQYHFLNDELVSFSSGQRLYESIPGENKQFFAFEDGTHNNFDLDEVLQRALGEMP